MGCRCGERLELKLDEVKASHGACVCNATSAIGASSMLSLIRMAVASTSPEPAEPMLFHTLPQSPGQIQGR